MLQVVFGKVRRGHEIVAKIGSTPTDSEDRPKQAPRVDRVTVHGVPELPTETAADVEPTRKSKVHYRSMEDRVYGDN
jgi:hypothetical protein